MPPNISVTMAWNISGALDIPIGNLRYMNLPNGVFIVVNIEHFHPIAAGNN